MKKIELSGELIKEIWDNVYGPSQNYKGWEFVAITDKWDGGEDRYRGIVVKNIEENYLLEISNYYNSWDEDWDPMVSIVSSEEVVKIEYKVDKNYEVKVKYDYE